MTKERRLGRGLEALLGAASERTPVVEERPLTRIEPRPLPRPELRLVDDGSGETRRIMAFDIDPNPYQPRREFAEADLESLAESLRKHGMLQPIVVREAGERFQLIAGERRLKAAIKAGWADVPARLVEADDRQAAELAIVENLQRKDLNPLEKAASFQQYLTKYRCTQEELASRLQIDRSTVANLIRLLELPAEVQAAVRSGELSQGHARALLPLGDEREQREFAERIKRDGLSVRATEALVQDMIHQADGESLDVISMSPSASPKPRSRARPDQVVALEQEFRLALGTKVEVKSNARGRGKITIHFGGHDEFERLREYLCGPSDELGAERAG